MRHERRIAAALLVLLAVSLTGCWDRKEVEQTAFVLAVGVDKGEKSIYKVTFAIALPGKMAGGKEGGGEGKPYMLTSVEAPTVVGAISLANSYLSRQVSLRHAKVLFMGEELARVSGMYTMDEFVRLRQTRRTILYVVTKGKAEEFLKGMDVQLEKDPQRFIEQLANNVRNTGTLPAGSQLQHFITTVNTGYSAPVTYYAALKEEGEEKSGQGQDGGEKSEEGFSAGELPRSGGPNIEMIGAAAFKGEKMVGTLTGEDMRMILLLQGALKRALFSIRDPIRPELYVSMEVNQGRPLIIDVDVSGSKPKLRAVVTLEAELLSVQSNVDYTEPELQPRLEAALATEVNTRMREVIAKSQTWETDVVGFGEHVVKEFSTVHDWEAFRWPERYKNADVETLVRVTLRRFGKQLSPPEAQQ